MDTIYTVSALIIAAICVVLVAHPQYEDGLFGRLALGLIALSELSVFWDSAIDGSHYGSVLPTTLAIQLGVLLFFVRHLYRFQKWLKSREHEWRPVRK